MAFAVKVRELSWSETTNDATIGSPEAACDAQHNLGWRNRRQLKKGTRSAAPRPGLWNAIAAHSIAAKPHQTPNDGEVREIGALQSGVCSFFRGVHENRMAGAHLILRQPLVDCHHFANSAVRRKS